MGSVLKLVKARLTTTKNLQDPFIGSILALVHCDEAGVNEAVKDPSSSIQEGACAVASLMDSLHPHTLH